MCVSAEVSFGMAGLLAAGGIFAVRKAYEKDMRYVPLALFPVLVGVQQAAEGFVWLGTESGASFLRMAALVYLFFMWVVWPSFVPYMTAALEENVKKRKTFRLCAQAGFLLGLVLYVPNFWRPDWLSIETIHHSVVYQCVLLPDFFMPREIPGLLYLLLIGLPPLLSSHRALRIFGAGLAASVPVAYFFFYYAYFSVLCFFAAIMTLYINYVILEDRCPARLMRGSTLPV